MQIKQARKEEDQQQKQINVYNHVCHLTSLDNPQYLCTNIHI